MLSSTVTINGKIYARDEFRRVVVWNDDEWQAIDIPSKQQVKIKLAIREKDDRALYRKKLKALAEKGVIA